MDATADATAAKLTTALRPRPGHVVVTAATAKDAEALLWRVESDIVAYRCLWLSGRELDPVRLLRALATEDVLAESPHVAIRTLLGKARAIGRPVVVVVTEADAASAADLERLRLTLECTPDASDVVRLVLLGGPALLEILRRPEVRALATRITNRIDAPQIASEAALPQTSRIMSEPLRVESERRPRRLGRILMAGAGGAAFAAAVGGIVITPSDPPASPIVATAVATAPTLDAPAAPPAVAEVAGETPAPPVEVMPTPEPTPPRAVVHPPAAPIVRGHAIQVGAFRSLANATALRDELARRFADVHVTPMQRNGTVLHRVRIEGLASEAAVTAALATLRLAGLQPMRVGN
jgi:cell division septation protein DedD